MNKNAVRSRIEEVGIIPSIRTSSIGDARFAAAAVLQSGIPILEITMTIPGALQVIAEISHSTPDLIVGAGTVLDLKTARHCVDAGARFLTGPGFDVQILEYAQREGVLVMPGALTPTEVTAAWRAGADLIKIFPCAQLGGASYIHALKAPFPDVPLVAAGGVNQQTAAEFIAAGAIAIGVGAELISKKAIQERDEHWIRELAHRFLNILHEARSQAATRNEGFDRR